MILCRRTCLTVNYLSRFSSSGVELRNYPFENKFSYTEKKKILNTLNSLNAEELSRYNVTQTRVKRLVNWKTKKGPFTTLSDLLEVDGVGVNILEKLCENILSNDVAVASLPPNNKSKRNILTPALSKDCISCLSSAVGVHVESTGVSWAKLERFNNNLTKWGYSDFSTLPLKVSPLDTFNIAVEIMQEIPPADVYIFESKHANGNNPLKPNASYTYQLELMSMLLTLMNTKNAENLKDGSYANKVYYIKSRLPARLFGVLIGSERVSTEAITLDLINGKESGTVLPCSKVFVEPKLVNDYSKCSNGYKDLLDQALLLVITFMDLCVYNNPTSLGAVSRSKK